MLRLSQVRHPQSMTEPLGLDDRAGVDVSSARSGRRLVQAIGAQLSAFEFDMSDYANRSESRSREEQGPLSAQKRPLASVRFGPAPLTAASALQEHV